jgi:hypothetical protein
MSDSKNPSADNSKSENAGVMSEEDLKKVSGGLVYNLNEVFISGVQTSAGGDSKPSETSK